MSKYMNILILKCIYLGYLSRVINFKLYLIRSESVKAPLRFNNFNAICFTKSLRLMMLHKI